MWSGIEVFDQPWCFLVVCSHIISIYILAWSVGFKSWSCFLLIVADPQRSCRKICHNWLMLFTVEYHIGLWLKSNEHPRLMFIDFPFPQRAHLALVPAVFFGCIYLLISLASLTDMLLMDHRILASANLDSLGTLCILVCQTVNSGLCVQSCEMRSSGVIILVPPETPRKTQTANVSCLFLQVTNRFFGVHHFGTQEPY